MAVSVNSSVFGKNAEGKDILLFSLKNEKGVEACVTNQGATLAMLKVPDKHGEIRDVVLGFDQGERYMNNVSVFGATVGPHANRIGGAEFELDGVTYALVKNDGPNNLHTDLQNGYQTRMWDSEIVPGGVTFTLQDTDGNMGFPGNKTIQVTYTLDDESKLTLRYHAESDKRTVFNLTNHTYFNLEGHETGNVGGHILQLKADFYTPVAKGAIPTGEILPVKGTPLDFNEEMVIGDRIDADMEQLKITGGYDHNYVIADFDGSLRHFATVRAPKSGIVMKAYTTLPGVQLYTGNFIDEQTGKAGVVYNKRHGVCLETQFYPDSIHHDNFPDCVFGEGRDYDSVTVYQFEV